MGRPERVERGFVLRSPSRHNREAATGIARVVCYSPKHNLALAELEICEIENLLRVWQEQYVELASHQEIAHVLIFEGITPAFAASEVLTSIASGDQSFG